MKPIQKILCPIDFSETSGEAIEVAAQLAANTGASMHLLYVLPRPNYYDWSYTGMSALVFDDEYFENTKQEVTVKLENLVKDMKTDRPGLSLTTEVNDEIDTSGAILNCANTLNADLIVIGSHGRRGLDRVLMGSVAESILRHASCGVMIYKSGTSK